MSEQMREALECVVERFGPIESTLIFSKRMAIKKCRDALAALSQREAAEPVGWQFFQDGKWWNGSDHNDHRKNTEEAGFPVRELYTAPPSREVPEEWKSELIEKIEEYGRDCRDAGMDAASWDRARDCARKDAECEELMAEIRALLASKGE